MKMGRKLFWAGGGRGVGGYRTREINNRNDIWALFRSFHSLLLSLFPRSPDESWLDSTAQSTKQGFIEALPWALHRVLVRNTLKCNGLFCAQGEKTVTHEKASRTKALYRQGPNAITEEPVTHKCSWWWEIEKTNKQTTTNKSIPFCVSAQFRKEDDEMTAVGKFRVLYKQRWPDIKFRSAPLGSRPERSSSSDGE